MELSLELHRYAETSVPQWLRYAPTILLGARRSRAGGGPSRERSVGRHVGRRRRGAERCAHDAHRCRRQLAAASASGHSAQQRLGGAREAGKRLENGRAGGEGEPIARGSAAARPEETSDRSRNSGPNGTLRRSYNY